MQLAAACGLPVAQVAVRRVPEPVYLVRRFDRLGDGLQAQRRYALDGCQLLSLDRLYKYQQATSDNLRALERISRMPAPPASRRCAGSCSTSSSATATPTSRT